MKSNNERMVTRTIKKTVCKAYIFDRESRGLTETEKVFIGPWKDEKEILKEFQSENRFIVDAIPGESTENIYAIPERYFIENGVIVERATKESDK